MEAVRILIVEDEVLIADTIERYLIENGYQVVGKAISFAEAQEKYLATSPDLVLLDIRLNGEKTGIDFAVYLQEAPESTPFIYLTSQFDGRSINQAKETFPAGYLSKPIQKQNLLANIEITMHKHRNASSAVPHIQLVSKTERYNIPVMDIVYLQTEHIYTRVNLIDGRQIVQRSPMRELLDQLPQEQFTRPHRSFAININHINHWDQQQIYLPEKAIPISRSNKIEILELLANHPILSKK